MENRRSAIFAVLPARVTLPLFALLIGLAGSSLADLPDLDTIRRWLRRIQELLVLGGMGLAIALSLVFIGAWVVSHLRRPRAQTEGEPPPNPWFSRVALVASFAPVGLTVIAALGLFVPVLRPLMLKMFAYAAVGAFVSWLISIAALIIGGGREELTRVRRALLLAGTPFYCLAVWLSRFLMVGG